MKNGKHVGKYLKNDEHRKHVKNDQHNKHNDDGEYYNKDNH
jgi:hypothetical protein